MADDLRHRYAEAIRAAADYPIIAEWICSDPVNPDHDLCVKGDIARQMLRAALTDDPESIAVPSKVLDAVMAVRDEELERLRRQAGWHGECVPITKWAEELRDKLNAIGQRDEQRERAEKAEHRRSAARDACHKAMADPDASTTTLAALHHVLAALDDTTAET